MADGSLGAAVLITATPALFRLLTETHDGGHGTGARFVVGARLRGGGWAAPECVTSDTEDRGGYFEEPWRRFFLDPVATPNSAREARCGARG